ncbi:hypothetical protein CEXT_327611 [Caerostris extrusa]|uniref:Uncharacterized protein n=1 Tax=Caerostris extrusa TaxID=172846 RepID=A0AAV4NSD6_CAEEX|nr:hypothetical protein CEXT_327611 [Caerostris extrusa]
METFPRCSISVCGEDLFLERLLRVKMSPYLFPPLPPCGHSLNGRALTGQLIDCLCGACHLRARITFSLSLPPSGSHLIDPLICGI